MLLRFFRIFKFLYIIIIILIEIMFFFFCLKFQNLKWSLLIWKKNQICAWNSDHQFICENHWFVWNWDIQSEIINYIETSLSSHTYQKTVNLTCWFKISNILIKFSKFRFKNYDLSWFINLISCERFFKLRSHKNI